MQVRIGRNGKEMGTYEDREIATLIEKGEISTEDYFYTDETKGWEKISEFRVAPDEVESEPALEKARAAPEPEALPQRKSASRRAGGAFGSLLRAAWHLVRAGAILLYSFGRLVFSWIAVPMLAVARWVTQAARRAELAAQRLEDKVELAANRLEDDVDN